MEVDIEIESDEDTEMQIKDLEQLTAVLEEDEPTSSVISKYSEASTLSLPCPSDKVEEYSKIETAIALNKLTDDKLLRLEKILVGRLGECRKKLADIQNSARLNEKVDKVQTFRYVNCGKPYFKDKSGFQPPDNPDTILMAKSDMFDFSIISSVPGWTVKDKSEFINLLLKMSKDIKIKEINSQIAQLVRDAKKNNISNDSEIAALKQEINRVKKKSLKELALPMGQNYDWDTIANTFSNRHTAQEFSSIWRLFLHPSINKNSWSKAEHVNLQEIAQNLNLQDWEEIACQLNTGRTEYQCFVYFRTNMGNTFTSQKWSKEEEEYLKRLIEYYREDNYIPWGRVAASIENRTKIQVYNKYLRLIELRKGRFLPEEDAVLLNCVEKYGENFAKIKDFLAGRSAAQLRSRYQILTRRISTVWTLVEDKKLLQMMANQDSTTNFASLSKFLPGKDRIHIRSRYITLTKWMQRHPNVDIKYAPRRGARRLCHGQASEDLNKAVEKLKDRIQSEVENKKSKRVTEKSTEDEIDESIIAFLVTENIKDTENSLNNYELALDKNTVLSMSSLNCTNLKKTLILLKAKLNQNAFKESSYYDQYPELTNPQKEVNLVKVKSYSKKDVVNKIKMNAAPDVWGNYIAKPAEYVMPPNFSTVTGCKSLIALASNKPSTNDDSHPMKRKNVIFREQMKCLMERFSILFLWPMLLSNEMPTPGRYSRKKKAFVVVQSQSNTGIRLTTGTSALRNSLLFEDSDDDDTMVTGSQSKAKNKVDDT